MREATSVDIARRFLGVEMDSENLEKSELNNCNEKLDVESPPRPPLVDNGDFVVDILNDELLQQVKQKIRSEFVRFRMLSS